MVFLSAEKCYFGLFGPVLEVLAVSAGLFESEWWYLRLKKGMFERKSASFEWVASILCFLYIQGDAKARRAPSNEILSLL